MNQNVTLATAPVSDTPDALAPSQDDPVQLQIQLAQERGRREALEQMMLQKQDAAPATPPPIAPTPPVAIPTDPLELLSASERVEMENLKISDPVAYGQRYATLAMQLANLRVQQQAAPLLASQARMIVEAFRSRMARRDGALAAEIEPIFDTMLQSVGDISPLVNMTASAQDMELGMRWDSAKAQVLEKRMNAAAPKQDPLLQSNPALGTPGSLKKSTLDDRPEIQRMAAEYGFTKEQITSLEEML